MQVTVGGTLLWVGGGEWGCMRHYFGWVGGWVGISVGE